MGYITPSGSAPGLTEAQLIDRVKIRMDEIDHNAVITVGTVDNYPITTMITNILNECKTDVLMHAPMALLPKVKYEPTNVTPVEEIEGAEIVMPDDTLRIAAFHNENWRKPVSTIATADSAVLSRQNYRYARATAKTPAVVLVDGTTYLAFPYIAYEVPSASEDDTSGSEVDDNTAQDTDNESGSGSSGSEVADSSEATTPTYSYGDFTVYYVSSYTGYADLGDKAIEALCWDCAAKVFAAMGMTENYNRCSELYQAALK